MPSWFPQNVPAPKGKSQEYSQGFVAGLEAAAEMADREA